MVLPNGFQSPDLHTLLGKRAFLYHLQAILVRAVNAERAEQRDVYQCPVYVTESRFRQEVFTAQLKTKQSIVKWTMAGVCLFLDVVS